MEFTLYCVVMVERHWEPLTPRKLGKFLGTPVYMCIYPMRTQRSERSFSGCCLKYLISLDLHLNVGTSLPFFLSFFLYIYILDQSLSQTLYRDLSQRVSWFTVDYMSPLYKCLKKKNSSQLLLSRNTDLVRKNFYFAYFYINRDIEKF